jgi:hypothetical protein
MIGTKLIAATVAGAAVGAGTFALAPSQAATGSSSAKSAHHAIARHNSLIHGSWVTRNKVHHEAIRGVVRTVSSTYITVRALDGYTQTYHVSSNTKVRVLGDDHKGLDRIGDVEVGDQALVAGVGNDQATHVVARKPKAASTTDG